MNLATTFFTWMRSTIQ